MQGGQHEELLSLEISRRLSLKDQQVREAHRCVPKTAHLLIEFVLILLSLAIPMEPLWQLRSAFARKGAVLSLCKHCASPKALLAHGV